MRPRTRSHTALRYLLSAGAAAVLLVSSCLNPQPDDFPQSGAVVPNERATTRPPTNIEAAPGDNAAATAPVAPPSPNFSDDALEPAAPEPSSEVPASGLGADVDAGVPADAGPPDAAPVVAQ